MGKGDQGVDGPEGGGGVCTDLDVWVDSWQNWHEALRMTVTGAEFKRASVLAGLAWQVGSMMSGQSTCCRGTGGGVWSRWYCDHSPACAGTRRRPEAGSGAGGRTVRLEDPRLSIVSAQVRKPRSTDVVQGLGSSCQDREAIAT